MSDNSTIQAPARTDDPAEFEFRRFLFRSARLPAGPPALSVEIAHKALFVHHTLSDLSSPRASR
jgi:hypothetical protein